MTLKLEIQTYQILTNDDEVCSPSLSSILLAVLIFAGQIPWDRWYFFVAFCLFGHSFRIIIIKKSHGLVALSAIFFCYKYFLTLKTKTIFSRNFHCSVEKKDEKRLARLDIRWKESAGSPMIVSPQIFCRILWECSVHKSDLIFVEQKVKGGKVDMF